MRQLILYSTAHCHLCEKALDLLMGMPNLNALQLDVVDVASDDRLLERYGERIPVLRQGKKNLPRRLLRKIWSVSSAHECEVTI